MQQIQDAPICRSVPQIARTSRLFSERVPFGSSGHPPAQFQVPVTGQGIHTVEIVAWIIGEYAQKQKLWGDRAPRDLFGLNLACDGFIIERRYNWMSSSPINNHFHVILNCDTLQLNADRTRFRATSTQILNAIKSHFEQFYKPCILKLAKEYDALRKEEDELERLYSEDCTNEDNRVDGIKRSLLVSNYPQWQNSVALRVYRDPMYEVDVVAILGVIAELEPALLPFEMCAMYAVGSDLVCQTRRQPPAFRTVEVELKLSHFFRHGHSTALLNGIVCWDIDGTKSFLRGEQTKHSQTLHGRLPTAVGGVPYVKPFWALETPPVGVGPKPYRVLQLVNGESKSVPQDIANRSLQVYKRIPVLCVSELLLCDRVWLKGQLSNPSFRSQFEIARDNWFSSCALAPALALQ